MTIDSAPRQGRALTARSGYAGPDNLLAPTWAPPLPASWRPVLGRLDPTRVMATTGMALAPPPYAGAATTTGVVMRAATGMPAMTVGALRRADDRASDGPSRTMRAASGSPVATSGVMATGTGPASTPVRTAAGSGLRRRPAFAPRPALANSALANTALANTALANTALTNTNPSRSTLHGPAPHGTIRPVVFAVDVAPAVRFATVLRSARPDPVGALPRHLRPLAEALAGPGPIGVRSGPTTRAALAAAGRRAATVGRVIHVESAPDQRRASTEIIAHELAHVARPSSRPRFFDDARHTPEEHLAVQVGRLARTLTPTELAPPPRRDRSTALAWGTAGLSVNGGQTAAAAGAGHAAATAGAGGSAGVVSRLARPPARSLVDDRAIPVGGVAALRQRFEGLATGGAGLPAETPTTGRAAPGRSAPDVIGPDVSGGSFGGGGAPGGEVRSPDMHGSEARFGAIRSLDGTSAAPTNLTALTGSATTASAPMIVRPPSPVGGPTAPNPLVQTGVPHVNPTPTSVGSSTAPVSEETIEWIIERIEQRIIDELERRGMRHNPGVF